MAQRNAYTPNDAIFSASRNPVGAGFLGQYGTNYGAGMYQPQMAPTAMGYASPMSPVAGGTNMGGYVPPVAADASWFSRFKERGASLFGGGAEEGANGLGGMGATGWGNVLQGAGMLGSAWLGQQQLKQGKKEFKFNKGMAERNLANSASLINTNIARRAESNAASLGLSGSQADAYVEGRKKNESVRGTI